MFSVCFFAFGRQTRSDLCMLSVRIRCTYWCFLRLTSVSVHVSSPFPFPNFSSACEVISVIIRYFNRFCYFLTFVPEMTYYLSSGTLKPESLTHSVSVHRVSMAAKQIRNCWRTNYSVHRPIYRKKIIEESELKLKISVIYKKNISWPLMAGFRINLWGAIFAMCCTKAALCILFIYCYDYDK